MVKFFVLGLILALLVGLVFFGAMAAGFHPYFFNDFEFSGRHGGCLQNDDFGSESDSGRCFDSKGYDCEGSSQEDCEDFCEEYEFEHEDCPKGNEECEGTGTC
jgi:hypothetical protein